MTVLQAQRTAARLLINVVALSANKKQINAKFNYKQPLSCGSLAARNENHETVKHLPRNSSYHLLRFVKSSGAWY